MKILIVENSPQKLRRILSLLTERCGLQREDIDVATCASDARAYLEDVTYELLLLDILIANRPEDDESVDASIELLEDIFETDHFHRPSRIVGLTAYRDAAEQVGPYFEERLWTLIWADEASNEWLDRVERCVAYIVNQVTSGPVAEESADLVLVAALRDPEFSAVQRLPWNWSVEEPLDDATFICRGKFVSGSRDFTVVATVAPRMGMVSTAIVASKLIGRFRPKCVAMVGICAGMRSRTNLGDVLVADPVWDYQSGKRVVGDDGVADFQIAPHQLNVDESLRAHVEQVRVDHAALAEIRATWPAPPAHELRVLLGPVASGSAVCADPSFGAEIPRQHRSANGLEMELYGLYAAASLAGSPRPTAIGFKSVCDFADAEKADDFQAYASYTSARVLQLFFERFGERLFG